MENVDRFNKRKQCLLKMEAGLGLSAEEVDQSLVEQFLNSAIDFGTLEQTEQALATKYDFEFNVQVSVEEVDELLDAVRKGFDDEKFNNLLAACRKDILRAVVSPFGLGRIVATMDKKGGNVSTLHNAKDGVFANEEDARNFSSFDGGYIRKDWDDPKERGKHYEKINRKLDAGKAVKDDYANGMLKKGEYDQDHITPLEQLNDDASLHLYFNKDERKKIANSKSNLAATDSDLNRHGKRAKTNAETIKNADTVEKYDISKRKMMLQQAKSELAIKAKKTLEVGKRISKTGVHEGVKMGTQQALGLLLCEFFVAVFDEVQDVYKNGYSAGFDDPHFLEVLKERLHRIAERLVARWKDVCKAFADGFLSGFLSNLVTVVINMFVRTGKRMVRIIREGFFSLMRAIKMLCFPPDGMTVEQAAHEASKLIGTGLVVAGGVFLEEVIDKLIKGSLVLEPFADILTTVLVGALTGIAATFVVYAIDKVDLLKVNDKERHEYVMRKLEADLEQMIANGECLVADIELG